MPGRVADRPEAVRHAHPLVDGDSLPRGLHADRVEAEAVDTRSPAGRHEQAIAAQLVAPGELEDVLVAVAPHAGGLLAEAELDPVRGERDAERVAERLRLAREHVVHALDERHGSAHAVDGLRHLDSDRAAAQHHEPARHLGQPG